MTTERKILRNRVRCDKCHDVVESLHVHDFKFCKCGAVAVDGGKQYLKRSWTKEPPEFTELSEVQVTKINWRKAAEWLRDRDIDRRKK